MGTWNGIGLDHFNSKLRPQLGKVLRCRFDFRIGTTADNSVISFGGTLVEMAVRLAPFLKSATCCTM
jgi:hypothetical protein